MDAFTNFDRLHAVMARHRIDAVVATSPENIRYLAGYTPFQSVWNRFPKAAVLTKGSTRPVAVLPISEAGFFIDSGAGDRADVRLFGRGNLVMENIGYTPFQAQTAEMTRSAGTLADGILEGCGAAATSCGRIVVDQTGAPEILDILTGAAGDGPDIRGYGEDVFRLARMVKTPGEIDMLRRAAALNERAIQAMVTVLAAHTEAEAAATYRRVVTEGGGHVQHITANAGRDGGCYRVPQPRRPEPGDRFRYDVGLELDGYCSDLGGTAVLAPGPTEEERATYAALTAGVDAAVSNVRPGMKSSDLYQLVIAAVRANGLKEYEFSLAGHGIGIEPRDYPILGMPMASISPYLGSGFDPEIEAGMVLNIECPLNVLGVGGYQHEVTMVVGSDGGRLLSPRRPLQVVG